MRHVWIVVVALATMLGWSGGATRAWPEPEPASGSASRAVPSTGRRVASRLFVLVSPDRDPGPSRVQAFDLSETGIPVLAESYPTFAVGRASTSPQDVEIARGGRFLYVANNVDGSITGYRVLPDGTLAPVGLFPAGGAVVTYLAAHPSAPLLYASTGGPGPGAIFVFRIGPDGSLVEEQRVPVDVPVDVEVDPDGRSLYLASILPERISRFHVLPSGRLDGRFDYPAAGRPWAVEVSSDGSRVYLLTLDEGLWTFAPGTGGDLALLDRTPIEGFTEALETTVDDRFAYVGEPNRPHVRGFGLGDDGLPTELPGSPFPARPGVGTLLAPHGPAVLYQVLRGPREVASFTIAGDGSIDVLASPVAVPGDGVPNGAAVLRACVVEVRLDVKPDSPENPINPRSRGVIPVAILGSADIDVRTIDTTSLRFGPAGAVPAHDLGDPRILAGHLADLDLDGRTDLVVHFRTEETGISCADERVFLVGETKDGCALEGSDSIRTVGNCE